MSVQKNFDSRPSTNMPPLNYQDNNFYENLLFLFVPIPIEWNQLNVGGDSKELPFSHQYFLTS